MTITLYALMFLALLGMLYGFNRQKRMGVVWGRPFAGVCGVIVLAMATTIIVHNFRGSTKPPPEVERYTYFLKSQMYGVGQLVAKAVPGKSVLLIHGATMGPAEFDHQTIGLKEGLGDSVTIGADRAVLPREMMAMSPDGEDQTADNLAKIMDKAVRTNSRAAAVVIYGTSSINFNRLRYHERAGIRVPKIFLAGGSNHEGLAKMIKAGVVAAFVIEKEAVAPTEGGEAEAEPKAPESYEAAFAERYVVITAANIDEFGDN